jgi:eukaryotic-like serine/threonine-protein kinase
MNTDRNLLFGVLALQLGLIDATRFAQACQTWCGRKGASLADLMLEAGWITPADRADLERLLLEKLELHRGEVAESLAAAADDEVRRVLSALDDPEVQNTLARLPRQGSHVLMAEMPSVGETRDRYTLTRLHAQGGIGRVWLARDADLWREVALKELLPERAESPDVWARFLQEARITGQLEHPGIVPVYELVRRQDDEHPFYTMRFVRGRTLTEAVRSYHGKRSTGQAGSLELLSLFNAFVAVCNAVAYAHARGVIHRDLKGQNVVLGDFGEVIVLDWGLAKVVGQAEGRADGQAELPPVVLGADGQKNPTLLGQALGTPAYMPPEQAAGELDQIDRRSDVYGLGAILYEILTGKPPFSGSDTDDVLRKVREEEPARPRQVCPSAPPALEAICLKALEKRPDDRYQSVTEMTDDVKRWLADEPVGAWREPMSVRARRWLGRHRTVLTAGAAAVLVAVVSLSVATVALSAANVRERDAKLAAQTQKANADHQRALADQSKAEAVNQAEMARNHANLAWESLDELLNNVSENVLLHEPGFQPLRQTLLQKALGVTQKLVDAPGNEPMQQLSLGQAYDRLGVITAEIGSKEAAADAFKKNIAILDGLFRLYQSPPTCPFHQLQAISYFHLGAVQSEIGQSDEALRSYEKARSSWAEMDCESPVGETMIPRLDARVNVAASTDNIGLIQLGSGRLAEALKSIGKASELARQAVREKPENTFYRILLGDIVSDYARVEARLGHWTKAAEVFQEAINILTPIVERNPKEVHAWPPLGKAYVDLGRLRKEAGQADESGAALQRARSMIEKRAAENPTVHQYRIDLASCALAIAALHEDSDRFSEALSALEQARALAEQLVSADPKMTEPRRLLAEILDMSGRVHRRSGHPDQAHPLHEQARKLLEKLLAASPHFFAFEADLARNLDETGAALVASGQLEEAVSLYKRSESILVHLTKTVPNDPSLVLRQGEGLVDLAEAQVKLRQEREAEKSFWSALALERVALEHLPKAGRPLKSMSALLRRLAEVEQQLGNPSEAASAALERRALSPDDPKELFDVARDLARCAAKAKGQVRYANEAIDTLRQAIAHGFKDRASLEREPDLEPLRSRDDFQSLLRDLRRQAQTESRQQGDARVRAFSAAGPRTPRLIS